MTSNDGEISASATAAPMVDRVPPQLFFVGSAVFHYLGPSFAVLLFARVPVGGVAWLRIVSAAVVFAVWRRPWRAVLASPAPQVRVLTVLLGGVFATMNYSFYVAIDRLPLGTVAAIEFVGPLVLTLWASRTARNLAAVTLGAVGVALLTDVQLDVDPPALVWAFANAALFTAYVVLAHRVAQVDDATSPIDRLGAAMLVAGLVITPLGLADAAPALGDPVALFAGIGVGLSSSVVPYVLDQLAMARISRGTYALFVALLPATAVVVGLVVLAQVPTAVELAAVGLVIGGVLVHRDPGSVA
ncbi:MAG: EamA family transporter [Actinomycetota bacterium]|nr:EamA family transporter [Actinomycetota bacterium]